MEDLKHLMALLALPYLFAAHFYGDYLMQTHHTTEGKSWNSWVCLLHVMVYSIPMMFVFWYFELGTTGLVLILLQHFAQDRWLLHYKLMRWTGRTDFWKSCLEPAVELRFVDQSMHLTFIAIVSLLIRRVI